MQAKRTPTLAGRADHGRLAAAMKLAQAGKRGLYIKTPQLISGEYAYAMVADEDVGGLTAGASDDQVVETEATEGHAEAATRVPVEDRAGQR